MPWAKPSLMCWAMSTGAGSPAGSAGSSRARAWGPPVETAMAITAPPAPLAPALGVITGAAGLASARLRRWRITGTPASIRSRAVKAGPSSRVGLKVASRAPRATAAMALAASAASETTRMRVGHWSMISAMACRPSISGIRRSMVTRSGRRAWARRTAARPSSAWPRTVSRGSPAMRALIRSRAVGLSSTTRTWMGPVRGAVTGTGPAGRRRPSAGSGPPGP